MRNVYSVKQVNAYIKNMFTQDFMLNRIYVKGEVSNCKYHTSGHIYFSLKDESGAISCIMFSGQRNGLGFRMQDGQQVIVLGTVTTYERDGKYQLYAKEIILDGAGLLYERFEALKKELGEMGMFSEEYKQPIPKFAKKIGVVTAPTGAAIRDIMNISARRNPYVQLLLYPALVQGDGAAASIVKGIEMLEKQGVDVIIVGRGGGSIEDLWAFNEELLARAIFKSQIPIISAVGHETDFTIADFVADLRAPTPSAAAELCVADSEDLVKTFYDIELRLQNAVRKILENRHLMLKVYSDKQVLKDPVSKINEKSIYFDHLSKMFEKAVLSVLNKKQQTLCTSASKLDALSPLATLARGYSVAKNGQNNVIRSVTDVKAGDDISITVSDGKINATVK